MPMSGTKGSMSPRTAANMQDAFNRENVVLSNTEDPV